MEYRLLGPVHIRTEEGDLFPSARKIQALLAVLLIRRDSAMSFDHLTAEIWGDRPPRRARAALHVYISQLRKMLPRNDSEGSRVDTSTAGYSLTLGRDSLDVEVFCDHVQQARTLLTQGRRQAAGDHLTAALELWQGPVLGDLSHSGPVLSGFLAWAREARLECVDLKIRTELALGNHRELVGPLYKLISENPLRESLYSQLMLALYLADRQAEALNVFHAARSALRTELGVEPAAGLRNLQQAILQGDIADDLRALTGPAPAQEFRLPEFARSSPRCFAG